MEQQRLEHLKQLKKNENYSELIIEIRKLISEDKNVLTDPFIKQWCGLRWRNIFLTEAVHDKIALKTAAQETRLFTKKVKRSPRRKIAERFLKGDAQKEWSIEMPVSTRLEKIQNTTLVFAPGLLSGMLPVRAFQTAFPNVEKKMGIRILQSDNHPVRGCEANTNDLLNAIEKGIGYTANAELISEEAGIPPKDFFLIGYSKGAVDILTLLTKRPDLKNRIRCIFNWGAAIGGSYLADDFYESIKEIEIPKAESSIINLLIAIYPIIDKKGILRRLDEFEIKDAIHDLTTKVRGQFLEEHLSDIEALKIPFFNVTGATSVLQVPFFQVQGVMELNRYDANNDMQLTESGATLSIPMATSLAMLNAHHWDISYDPFPKMMRLGSPNLDHPFPKEAAVTAMIQLGVELGLID